MTVIKNRDVPGGKEFWDHVENVAANFQPPEIKSDSIGGRGMMTAEQWLDAQANQCVVIGEFRTSDGCFVLVDENREPIPIPKLAITRMLEAYHRAEATAQLAGKEREIARLNNRHVQFMVEGGPVVMATDFNVMKARAEAAEERLKEAQARIKELEG